MKLIQLLVIFIISGFTTINAQYIGQKLANPYDIPWGHKTVNLNGWYDVTNSLPAGYVKDGTVDYTEYLQQALNKYDKIIMPNFPVCVTGVFTKSNQALFFREKSQLILQPTNKERYQVLGLHGVQNVVVYNANIKGDLPLHKGTKGEWGFGIDIRNSRNIKLYNSTISDCWGDGLIFAEGKKGFNSASKTLFSTENIYIDGMKIDYIRRNGISIINGSNLILKNIIISNVFGAAPKAGIDIEPDLSDLGKLNEIQLKNIKIFNAQAGIALLLDEFVKANTSNTTNISIEGLEVRNTQSGMYLSGYSKKQGAKKLGGIVALNNYKTDKVEIPIRVTENSVFFPIFYISNYSIKVNNKVYYNNKQKLLERTKTDRNLIMIK